MINLRDQNVGNFHLIIKIIHFRKKLFGKLKNIFTLKIMEVIKIDKKLVIFVSHFSIQCATYVYCIKLLTTISITITKKSVCK